MKTNEYEETRVLAEMLFNQFRSLTISQENTAEVTQRSIASLKRDRNLGVGIPTTKLGRQGGSDRVMYNIYDVAKFIVLRKTKVNYES